MLSYVSSNHKKHVYHNYDASFKFKKPDIQQGNNQLLLKNVFH